MRKSGVLESDIHDVLADNNIPWSMFRNSAVLITGATGLIGGLLVRTLSAANLNYKLNIEIIAHGRNTDKGTALARECGIRFKAGDITKPISDDSLPQTIDFIFHCAAVTASAVMVANPVEVITISIDGTKNILDLAHERNCRSFVFLSSMEVYGKTGLSEVTESDLGYIDLSDPRSSYPESKRLCELLCNAYATRYGVPVKIARPALTFGAGTPNDAGNTRVANQFARKALAGEDIELHTPGSSVSNCCYTADAVRGLLTILLKGKDGQAYNLSNPLACATIREMADLVANKVCEGRIGVAINVPKDIKKRGYAPDVGHKLNTDKLNALGWTPKYGLEYMFRRMIADWRGEPSPRHKR